LVHSSLKSIGYVAGGPDTVIDALMEAVGEDGLLMMPTFTPDVVRNVSSIPFNHKKSASTTGIITETFRLRANTLRSRHPTHSVAVWGKDAPWYIEHHNETTGPFDYGTPIFRFIEKGGYILLIGVTHNRNSSIHVAESLLNPSYLNVKRFKDDKDYYLIETEQGAIIRMPVGNRRSGHSGNFDIIEELSEVKNVQKECFLGSATVKLMKGQNLINILLPVLSQNPAFLLCKSEDCYSCSERRKRLK